MTENANTSTNSAAEAELRDEIKALARMLRVPVNDLAYLQQLKLDDIRGLRLELRTALDAQRNAFRQSMQHASAMLPRMARRPIRKLFPASGTSLRRKD